jgi:hypothetical protein
MELAELSFPYEARLHLSRFVSLKEVVLKIHLVREIKVTGLRFPNRRRLTRRPPTAVVNCGLRVTAVHAGLLTYIYVRNGFRQIPNARPSPSVPTFTASENVTTSLTFASLRSQYQWHHQSQTSYRIRIRCGGSWPVVARTFGFYLLSNMPWHDLARPPRRSATTRNPNRCSKRRSRVNCESRGRVHGQLTPVLWEKWKECASCFLELCKILHSICPEHFLRWSWYALSVLESLERSAVVGYWLPRSVAPNVQRRFCFLPAILSKRINSKWARRETLRIAASPCKPYSLIRRFAVIAEPEGF